MLPGENLTLEYLITIVFYYPNHPVALINFDFDPHFSFHCQ